MSSIKKIIISLLSVGAFFNVNAQSNPSKISERRITGNIMNAVTGQYVSDSIKVDILDADGKVVASGYNHLNTSLEYRNGDELVYQFDVPVKAAGDSFIVSLRHPDYDEISYPAKLNGYSNNIGRLKIRKLSKYEKDLMLAEVVVKASVVQVVNKGDTIQYNADAFAVAQGSMLDALLEKMPGVELRENGRIYVNGRFVDKLLLDGKDFFQGDQFVLLQNLPAYTVKNIKVYEQASLSREVFGRKVESDPDKYVIDVTLKKGYNNGWMGNVEAGGGTHSRYRTRGFAAVYNKNFRLGAFGYLNNLNETRDPGRDGDWSDAENASGLTSAKAGGLSYGYFASDRTVEFTGTSSAQYSKTDRNTLTNIQNFLIDGDTYTRRWNDNLNRNLTLSSDNTLIIRPKEGNKYNHYFNFNINYGNEKRVASTTEATFGHSIGDAPDLRDKLNTDNSEEIGYLNRYLSAMNGRMKNLEATLYASTTHSISKYDNGISAGVTGTYKKSNSGEPDFDNYLLQTKEMRVDNKRSNPLSSHGYNYVVYLQSYLPLNSSISLIPRIDFFYNYDYKNNNWYTNSDTTLFDRSVLPSMRAETMLRLDPRNSYVTGKRYTNIRPWLQVSYFKSDAEKRLSTGVSLQANIRHSWIDFNGLETVKAGKNYVSPSLRGYVNYMWHKMTHSLRFNYEMSGSEIDPFNLINVMFDSDPLNHRIGNPDLNQALKHTFSLSYYNSNWMLNRIRMNVNLQYEITDNQIAMSYDYDRATGIRTYKPVNVKGNTWTYFNFSPTIALTRDKKLTLTDGFNIQQIKSVDMMSFDGFSSTRKSIVNSLYISDDLRLEYNTNKFMVAFDGNIATRRSSSTEDYFSAFRTTQFRYGFRGRVSLPAGFEISTDIKMHSNRGFDYAEMNTNQLRWNARISKSLLKGKLLLFADGYDLLHKIKNISYFVNAQGRTETWVNNIPSYVMFSARWTFAKAPRE